MSYRFDTPLIVGAFHFGNRGLGVLGSEIPSGGEHGPSYMYNDLSLPADANKEYQGFVEVPPGVGVFFSREDGSFDYTGPSASFTYRLKEDGIDKGTQVVYLTTTSELSSTLSWSEDVDVGEIALTVFVAPSGVLEWFEAEDIFSTQAQLLLGAVVSWEESPDTSLIVGDMAGVVGSAISWLEDVDTYNTVAQILVDIYISQLDVDDICQINGAVESNIYYANIVWQEVNDSFNISAAIPVYASLTSVDANDITYISITLPNAVSPLPSTLKVKFLNPSYKITFKQE